jgi:hypothetical protein
MTKAIANGIQIEYSLTGTGWSNCRITIGETSCAISASYLSDALGELADAIRHIVCGADRARTSFDEEPGEFRWIFLRNDQCVEVSILFFEELWGGKTDEQGRVLFNGTCSVSELSLAMKNMLEDVLTKNGIKGYKEKWVEHDFPTDAYLWVCEKLLANPIDLRVE